MDGWMDDRFCILFLIVDTIDLHVTWLLLIYLWIMLNLIFISIISGEAFQDLYFYINNSWTLSSSKWKDCWLNGTITVLLWWFQNSCGYEVLIKFKCFWVYLFQELGFCFTLPQKKGIEVFKLIQAWDTSSEGQKVDSRRSPLWRRLEDRVIIVRI